MWRLSMASVTVPKRTQFSEAYLAKINDLLINVQVWAQKNEANFR